MNRNSNTNIQKIIIDIAVVIAFVVIGLFGYNYFSKKAFNSKALSELKQIQETILTELVATDGGVDKTITIDGVTFRYELSKGRSVFEGSLKTNDNGATFTKELKENITDLDKFTGTFTLEDGVIIYTINNGKGKAKWISGELPSSISKK